MEFDFIDKHKLVIERVGKKYKIILLDPARTPIPIRTLGKEFWFDWTRNKPFLAELAEKVGCSLNYLIAPLEAIGSKIELKGKRILEPQRPPKKAEPGKEVDKVDPMQYFSKREDGEIDKFIPGWLGEDIKEDFRFATMRDNEEVYVYQDGVYHRRGEVLTKEEARRRLTNTFAREGYINETVAHIKETTYVDRKEFDNPYNLIAVENGLLDVLTGKLQPHTPEKLIIAKLPILYNKEADCPKIRKFLSEIHHEEDIRTVQEMVGYCLLRSYPFAVAFMLLGSGSNGKSTELNLIEALLGEENVATPALHDLLYNRFSKAELFQKLGNIHADIPSTKLKYTGTFKMLTGQDTIYMERKNKDPFCAKNYAKLIYSANELPETEDLTLAFFRRWILLKFPNVFPENDPKTDPRILEKLTTPEELSGFLNWALKGLHRLLKQGHFTRTRQMKAVEDEWIMQTDSLRAFVRGRVKVERGTFVTKDEFYKLYTEFCGNEDISAVTKSSVGHRLPTIIPQVSEFTPEVRGKRCKSWKDVHVTDVTEVLSYSQRARQNSKDEIKDIDNIKVKVKKTVTSVTPQAERIRRICKIIDALERENESGAPVEEVKRIAESEGITPSFVDELINQEKQRGRVYEPKPGFVARVEAVK